MTENPETAAPVDDPAAAGDGGTQPDANPDTPSEDPTPDDPDAGDEGQAVEVDCPTPHICFTGGIAPDTYSVGCQHGTWVLASE